MLNQETKAAGESAKSGPQLYSLFGLTIRSAVPLPCPAAEDRSAVADVEFVQATAEEISQLCTGPTVYSGGDAYWQDTLYQDGAAKVEWKDHFDFRVSGDGRRVLWRRSPRMQEEALITYLLGHALSYCLLARGIESLHATAVEFRGQALALLGDSGYGKSTLAAGLLARGCRLLTDDVLVIRFEQELALVRPSQARIKLLPESADAVFDGRRSVTMNSFTRKMIFNVSPSQHAPAPAPLKRIYLVPQKSGARIGISSVRGRAAFLKIVKNTFNNVVLTPERIKTQFIFATELTSRVPVKRLAYPKRLELLPEVIDRILADLERS